MNTQEIKEKLTAVIQDINVTLKEPPFSDTDLFNEDLGFDSLDEIETLMMVEEQFSVHGQFSIQITDEDAEKIKTFGDAVSLLAKLLPS